MLSAAELHDAIVLATGRPGEYASGQKKVPMVTEMSEAEEGGQGRDSVPDRIRPE